MIYSRPHPPSLLLRGMGTLLRVPFSKMLPYCSLPEVQKGKMGHQQFRRLELHLPINQLWKKRNTPHVRFRLVYGNGLQNIKRFITQSSSQEKIASNQTLVSSFAISCPELVFRAPFNQCFSGRVSAYSTHKNLAVRKIMEAMRTTFAKRDSASTHDANYHGTYASIWKESAYRLWRTFYSTESERSLWNGEFFSLVRICEFLYANFSSTCVRCTHLFKR